MFKYKAQITKEKWIQKEGNDKEKIVVRDGSLTKFSNDSIRWKQS